MRGEKSNKRHWIGEYSMKLFSPIWHWFVGVGIVILVIGITIPFVQTNDTPVSEETHSPDNESEVDPVTKVELQQQEVPAQRSSTVNIDPTAKAELQQFFNDLRKEYLDTRAESINWWLTGITIVLGFFAVVIAIAGYIGFREFRRLRDEASRHVAAIRQDRAESNELLQNMRQKGNAEVFSMLSNNEEFAESLRDLLQNPELSLIDKAIAEAFALQQDGAIEEAIEKWNFIADRVAGTDDDLAARAWFSIGYLRLQNQDPEIAIPAYDEAIRLKPNYVEAYNDRGNAKNHLGQHEEAIMDYDQAIVRDTHYADAYCNRGKARCGLAQYDAAIADCNTAIQLRLAFPNAYVVRGEAKTALGDVRGAKMDFETALNLLDIADQQGQTDLRISIVLGLRELNDTEW